MSRVLVVDDDPDILEAMRHLLAGAGYDVAVAVNGREALKALDAGGFGLVVTDLMMPVMDGWQFIEELRKGPHAALPVLVISAAHDLPRKARALSVQGHAAKPLDFDKLIGQVGALVAA